jgi:hypothetical protein
MTRADRELQHRVQACHAGDSPPIVTHYIVAADHSQMT